MDAKTTAQFNKMKTTVISTEEAMTKWYNSYYQITTRHEAIHGSATGTNNSEHTHMNKCKEQWSMHIGHQWNKVIYTWTSVASVTVKKPKSRWSYNNASVRNTTTMNTATTKWRRHPTISRSLENQMAEVNTQYQGRSDSESKISMLNKSKSKPW